MKNFSLFLLLGFACIFSNPSSAQWTQTNGPEIGGTYCLANVGEVIWAGTADGIYTSKDRGLTWQKYPLLNNLICCGIYSHADTTIVLYIEPFAALTDNGGDVYSITSFDGTHTWSSPVYAGLADPLDGNDKLLRVQNTFVLQSFENAVPVSYDYGLHWSLLSFPSYEGVGTILSSKNALLKVETSSTIFPNYTTDSYYISTDGLHSYQFMDSGQHFADEFMDDSIILLDLTYYDTITTNKIIRSTNLGVTWDTVFTLHQPTQTAGFFSQNDTLYAYVYDTSNSQRYYLSADRGVTWRGPVTYFTPAFEYGFFPLHGGNLLGLLNKKLTLYIPSQDTSYPAGNGIHAQNVYSLFPNRNTLYASTTDACFKSIDQGQTWQLLGQKIGSVTDMLFIGDTIFAASADSVRWSYDNGITWSSYSHSGSGYNSNGTLAFINGRVVYSGPKMVYTDDYGATWQVLPDLPSFGIAGIAPMGNVAALNGNLFAASTGFVFKYNQINSLWDSIGIFPPIGSNLLYVLDSILVFTANGELLRSYDYGHTWSLSPSNIAPLSIVSLGNLWIGTGDTLIYTSSDSGSSWQPLQNSPLPFTNNSSTHDLTVMNSILYSKSLNSGVWRRTGTFSTLSGIVYRDLDNNGVRDPGEPGMSGVIVHTTPSGVLATTDTGGHYSLFTDAIGDSLTASPPVSFVHLSPGYYLTTGTQATGRDFGVYIPDSIADLSIDLTADRRFGWGSPIGHTLTLSVLNKGSLPQAAIVTLVLDSGFTYTSASPAPTYTSLYRDSLVWVTDTLSLLQGRTIKVSTQVYGFIGDHLACHATVAPVIGDTFPIDNYASLQDSIIDSFDPNSKECAQGSHITPEQAAASPELTYNIRFQNDGNAPAVNIKISDTLSSSFDASSFHLIAASYPTRVELSGQGIVDFYLDNINLPPYSQDSLNSCGFVKYGITCKKGLTIGNALANIANIYFDSNPPIVTNEALTIVAPEALPSSIKLINTTSQTDFKVYPNPTSGRVYIDMSQAGYNGMDIEIYDGIGRMVTSRKVSEAIEMIDMSRISDGIYTGMILKNGIKQAAFRVVLTR